MKQVFVRFLVLLIGILMMYGCGKHAGKGRSNVAEAFNEDLVGSEDEWVLYRSKDFSISFPPIFQLDTSGIRNTRLLLNTELTDDGDIYRDNIALLIKERENNLSLESFGKKCEKDILLYTESPEIISSGLKERNGQDYYEIIYSERLTDYRLIRQQHILFSGQLLYSITLTCEDAVFDQCREVGEAIMYTLSME